MELARPAAALLLGGVRGLWRRRSSATLWVLATAVAALAAKLSQQLLVVAGEPAFGAEVVVGSHHPGDAPAERERNQERRAGLEAEPVERQAQGGAGVADALADPAAGHFTGHAADERDPRLADVTRCLAGAGGDRQLVAVLEPDHQRAGVHEGAGALDDEVEEDARDPSPLRRRGRSW